MQAVKADWEAQQQEQAAANDNQPAQADQDEQPEALILLATTNYY